MSRVAGLALGALVATTAPASGQAWLQWDQSAATIGRGGAVGAVARDASAAFYNPAGIANLFGTHLRVDAVTARAGGEFHAFGAGSFDRDAGFELAGGLYATHSLTGELAVGLAVNTPWRHSVEWERPGSFVGRFRATDTALRSYAISPVIAWEALPGIAVGGGPVFTYGVLELGRFEQDPEFSAIGGAGPIALARSRYDMDGHGIGWTLGAAWRIDDRLSVGAHLRSGADLDLVGPVGFEDVTPAELREFVVDIRDSVTVGDVVDARYVPQEAVARFPLPAIASGGVAWSPVERVELTADLQWIGWSDLQALELDFLDDDLDDRQPFGYDDSWAYRAGVEVRHRPGQVVRLGFARVASPARSGAITPLVPDSDRTELSGGVGWEWRGVTVDLAYRVAFLADREGIAFPGDPAPDGVYESTEHMLAVGIAHGF